MTKIKISMVRGAALLAVLLSIIDAVQLFSVATQATWIPRDYTPMMMAYNAMNGNSSPSGAGPASAVSIMMALVAGMPTMIYALVQRKAD